MASSFTWLDYSQHERQIVSDIIHQFDDKTTRDELGIGSIRDAFAELLFPGTSTIQTRARYFLFIPWIYLALEKRGTRQASADARQAEVKLIYALEKAAQAGGTVEGHGIIGLRAKDKLQRLPSSVYWQGL